MSLQLVACKVVGLHSQMISVVQHIKGATDTVMVVVDSLPGHICLHPCRSPTASKFAAVPQGANAGSQPSAGAASPLAGACTAAVRHFARSFQFHFDHMLLSKIKSLNISAFQLMTLQEPPRFMNPRSLGGT